MLCTGMSRRALAGALVATAALAGPAAAQTATALLVEDQPIPGAGGATADGLNNTAVNHVGGYACSVSSSDDVSRIWGNAAGGAGAVMRAESTIGDLEQTGFESFFGISDSGQVAYSPTCTDTVTMTTGLDSVWLDDAVVAIEEGVAGDNPGFFYSFGSRPSVTGDGKPHFVGGLTSEQGTSTQFRGLWSGNPPVTVLLADQSVPNLPNVINPVGSSIDFDYRFSALGNEYIELVNQSTGSTSDDGTMVVSGAGLLIDGQLVVEASPVPAAAGGVNGENWDNFDFMGITESGKYFFTGDTDADTSADEFIFVNGQMQHREGDILDGFELSGSIEGAYMNEQGDLAFIWDVNDPEDGNVEALYFNGELLLKEGDEVDLDGDGVIDAGAVISSFTGISSLTLGDQMIGQQVQIYFTADIDTEGTSSTTDDVEGFFCLDAVGAECFLVWGDAPGVDFYTPGNHTFATDVANVTASWAVLMEDIPTIALDLPVGMTSSVGVLGGAANGRPTVVDSFAVQVVMWNPWVFPGQPEQSSPVLQVDVMSNGRVRTMQHGTGVGGMEIWHEVVTEADGSKAIRFPFSIPGF